MALEGKECARASGSLLESSAFSSARGRPNLRALALRLAACALIAAALGCSQDGDDGEASGAEPAFPVDYAASFSQVRDCRSSSEHELNRIRVLADAAALAPYRDRNADFTVGAVVLKEEHEFADIDCTSAPVRWTLMKRLAAGSSPETLDWSWQDVDAARRVTSEDASSCIGCHTGCGVPPEGYLGTCTVVGASNGAAP